MFRDQQSRRGLKFLAEGTGRDLQEQGLLLHSGGRQEQVVRRALIRSAKEKEQAGGAMHG